MVSKATQKMLYMAKLKTIRLSKHVRNFAILNEPLIIKKKYLNPTSPTRGDLMVSKS
jgi:hypothetical protein